MLEFRNFVYEANVAAVPGTAMQANAQANAAVAGSGTTSSAQPVPGQPIKPVQPNQPNQPAMAAQQVTSIANAVKDLKTINPAIDVNQAVSALTTDKITPQNTKALDAIGTALAPALADKGAATQIKSLAQRLQQR
jgi:hypothetical protein